MTPHAAHHGRVVLGALAFVLGLVLLAGVVVLWAGTPEPAGAAGADVPPGFELSTDKVHWSASLGEPLFDPAETWAPGQAGSRVVYVRNDLATASEVQVSVRTHGGRRGDVGWAVVSAKAEGRPWAQVPDSGSAVVLRDLSLGPGEVQAVQVRAWVDSAAGAAAMGQALGIDVDVRPADGLAERAASSPTLWPGSDVAARSLVAALGGLLALLALGLVRHRRDEVGG